MVYECKLYVIQIKSMWRKETLQGPLITRSIMNVNAKMDAWEYIAAVFLLPGKFASLDNAALPALIAKIIIFKQPEAFSLKKNACSEDWLSKKVIPFSL